MKVLIAIQARSHSSTTTATLMAWPMKRASGPSVEACISTLMSHTASTLTKARTARTKRDQAAQHRLVGRGGRRRRLRLAAPQRGAEHDPGSDVGEHQAGGDRQRPDQLMRASQPQGQPGEDCHDGGEGDEVAQAAPPAAEATAALARPRSDGPQQTERDQQPGDVFRRLAERRSIEDVLEAGRRSRSPPPPGRRARGPADAPGARPRRAPATAAAAAGAATARRSRMPPQRGQTRGR